MHIDSYVCISPAKEHSGEYIILMPGPRYVALCYSSNTQKITKVIREPSGMLWLQPRKVFEIYLSETECYHYLIVALGLKALLR